MFAKFDEYSDDYMTKPKQAKPSTKWIGKINCQGNTGLYATKRRVQRIFVIKEDKPNYEYRKKCLQFSSGKNC